MYFFLSTLTSFPNPTRTFSLPHKVTWTEPIAKKVKIEKIVCNVIMECPELDDGSCPTCVVDKVWE